MQPQQPSLRYVVRLGASLTRLAAVDPTTIYRKRSLAVVAGAAASLVNVRGRRDALTLLADRRITAGVVDGFVGALRDATAPDDVRSAVLDLLGDAPKPGRDPRSVVLDLALQAAPSGGPHHAAGAAVAALNGERGRLATQRAVAALPVAVVGLASLTSPRAVAARLGASIAGGGGSYVWRHDPDIDIDELAIALAEADTATAVERMSRIAELAAALASHRQRQALAETLISPPQTVDEAVRIGRALADLDAPPVTLDAIEAARRR